MGHLHVTWFRTAFGGLALLAVSLVGLALAMITEMSPGVGWAFIAGCALGLFVIAVGLVGLLLWGRRENEREAGQPAATPDPNRPSGRR